MFPSVSSLAHVHSNDREANHLESVMKYLYGPVPSRRLGLSLGVDIVPMKTCSLSCMYCQVGKTPETTLERKEYISAAEIIDELKSFFESGGETDWVTFSGSGEPTLNSKIGFILDSIKSITDKPVCVITNATLLSDPDVRGEIMNADAVMPSLDSAVDETFNRVCRPHKDLSVSGIVDGLVAFRNEYKGEMWLEIMLVAGINDSETELEALKAATERIKPDIIQLNTVARPPAELSAKPLTPERMAEIRDYFGETAEVIASFKGKTAAHAVSADDAVSDYLRRRPGSIQDIMVSQGLSEEEVQASIDKLVDAGKIIERVHFGKHYWEYIQPGITDLK